MKDVRCWMWTLALCGLALGAAACSTGARPAVAPTATPKPPAAIAAPTRVAPAATAVPAAAAKPTAAPAAAAKPTAAAQSAGSALNPQFAALRTVVGVQSAQAYIDGAGFHGMAEEMEKAKELKPSYVGKVRNVMAAANAVPWPSDLAKEQQKLMADLKALESALVANKFEAAHEAVEAIHESQHDLSKGTFSWLKDQSKLGQATMFKAEGDANHMLGCIGVQSAMAYVDGAGFHGMAGEMEKAKELKPSYVGKVRNVMAVANAVPWPSDLAKEQQTLMADLKALESALVANKFEAAHGAVEAIHESQHDLSKGTFSWLASQKHNFGPMMGMMAGDRMMQGAMVAGVQSAMAYVDGAGFHGMAEEMEKAKELKPSYVGKVRNVMAVANAVPWPSDLAKEQQKLMADLKALESALVANKFEAAHGAVEAIHESQHDLSKGTFSWLGTQKGG